MLSSVSTEATAAETLMLKKYLACDVSSYIVMIVMTVALFAAVI